VDGSNALLHEPMFNFNANFCCLAADKIAAFCHLSVRASVRDKSEHCENGYSIIFSDVNCVLKFNLHVVGIGIGLSRLHTVSFINNYTTYAVLRQSQ